MSPAVRLEGDKKDRQGGLVPHQARERQERPTKEDRCLRVSAWGQLDCDSVSSSVITGEDHDKH